TYMDGATERSVRIPKGDVLHQFREDVTNGRLPAVSWLVASARFSDHPGGPWYGVWYLSEVIDILTKNPDVWKKTIFILNYDENDGYFDHVPPFVTPNPHFPNSGKTSAHIDTRVEHVAAWQEVEHVKGQSQPGQEGRTGPIGLGYRVPMIVASPWSRGGAVCSQVFDHTSVLQLLERFCSHKSGKKIEETNISAWRRSVCGDLSACFKPYHGEALPALQPVGREEHMELITNARFKPPIPAFVPLSADEIAAVNKDPGKFPLMPQQEKGIRPSRPLPYQLYTGGSLSRDKKSFSVSFHSSKEVFRDTAAGCPFIVYATGTWKDGPWHPGLPGKDMHWSPVREMRVWNYTVAAGDTLTDDWNLADFDEAAYHLEVYGPNGYYRVFGGNAADPELEIACEYQRSRLLRRQLTGNIQLEIVNHSKEQPVLMTLTDNAYGGGEIRRTMTSGSKDTVVIDCGKSFGWYDVTVRITGNSVFERRFAGHVETGKESFSDPLMGQMV
ncbi:MAG TPA: alkaline phosphatase family protein, partial [Puia sp.]|nr:alkaline phosphatase family protein [Puia sp.]